jgi:hypothetical protein
VCGGGSSRASRVRAGSDSRRMAWQLQDPSPGLYRRPCTDTHVLLHTQIFNAGVPRVPEAFHTLRTPRGQMTRMNGEDGQKVRRVLTWPKPNGPIAHPNTTIAHLGLPEITAGSGSRHLEGVRTLRMTASLCPSLSRSLGLQGAAFSSSL